MSNLEHSFNPPDVPVDGWITVSESLSVYETMLQGRKFLPRGTSSLPYHYHLAHREDLFRPLLVGLQVKLMWGMRGRNDGTGMKLLFMQKKIKERQKLTAFWILTISPISCCRPLLWYRGLVVVTPCHMGSVWGGGKKSSITFEH